MPYLRRIVFLAALLLTVLFILFVINQTAQVVNLASAVSPWFGQAVLFLLLVFYAVLIIVPLVWILKMPKTLIPPKEREGEEYEKYVQNLARRLNQNPYLEGYTVDPRDLSTVEEALSRLNKIADERIKSASSNVFIMTAISQYGALDTFIVLISQFRMLWQVVTLYNQRPNLKEIVYLFSNVFATAFLASRIENIDLLDDQLEPVIAAIMGSSLTSLAPTFNATATIVTNSIIQGSANAFLTLRVGIITKMYSSSLSRQEKSSLRRAAALEAATLLGKVLGESGQKVSKIIFRAAARTGVKPFRYGQDLITKTGQKTWSAGKYTVKKGGGFVKDLTSLLKQKGSDFNSLFFEKKDPGPPSSQE